MSTTGWLTLVSAVFLVIFILYTLYGPEGAGAGQSKKSSAREALMNIAIGYGISFISNYLVLPTFGHPITVLQNIQIGLIFTVISIVRSYMIRRYFNDLITGKKR